MKEAWSPAWLKKLQNDLQIVATGDSVDRSYQR